MDQHSAIFENEAKHNHDMKPKQSLFPSAGNISSEKSATQANNLDWLENKSFTADTAKKFVEFQEEFKLLQGEESGAKEVIDGNSVKSTGQRKSKGLPPEVERQSRHSREKSTNSEDFLEAESDEEKNSTLREKAADTKSKRQEFADRTSNTEKSNHKARKHKKKYYHSSDSDSSERRHRRKKRHTHSPDSGSTDRANKKKKKHKHSSDSESSSYNSHNTKKKKSKHHKKKKSHKKEKDTQETAKDLSRAQLSTCKKIFLEEFDDMKPQHAYRLDRTRDPNSWAYGSLYKLHIPNYRCYFYGCLGCRHVLVDVGDSKKKNKKSNKTSINRYYGKENRELTARLAEAHVMSGANLSIEHTFSCSTELPAYMEVESDKAKDGKTGVDVRQQILDESTSLYVQGKGVGEVVAVEEEKPKDPVMIKVAELNRKLRESPHDVQLWLDFVKFQDTLMDTSDVRYETIPDSDVKQYTRSALDKKISILDKALESNAGNLDLLLARLDLCREMWDAARVGKELEQLLFVHPANIRLWKHYLMFNQSRMSVFTVSKVTRLYHKCFKTLNSVMDGKLQTHSVPEKLAEDVTGLFVQYCYFLKQAGHREKCVATLQAMLEYNLFCPQELESVSKETKLAVFEKFWDSSCSKLGTTGAKGWSTWEEGNCKQDEMVTARTEDDLEDLEQDIIDKNSQKYETWLEVETLRERHHWFPWQPDTTKGETEDDCEDMERLVLFDDISPALFNVPQHLHNDLVMVLIDILGLKPELRSKLKSNLLLEFTSEVDGVDVSSLSKSAELPTKSTADCCVPQQSVVDFVGNLLEQIITISEGSNKLRLTVTLMEIRLQRFYRQKSSLSKSDKKEMRKIVKNVLKDEANRNNLFLWMAYIDLEKVIGKAGEAQSVAETALAMHSGDKSPQETPDKAIGLVSLGGQYCDILLNITEKTTNALWERSRPVSMETRKKVISVIHCIIEGRKFNASTLETVSSTETLKVSSKISKLLETVCGELVNSVEIPHIELLVTKLQGLYWCYTLFTYCAKDLSASLRLQDNILPVILAKRDIDTFDDLGKALMTMQLRLVLYHMSTSSASLHILRELLDTALSMYPNEVTFVSLFIDIERKSRISGRFNRFFDNHCRSQASPAVVVMAVLAQLKYLHELSAHDHSDTASGEAGVSSSALVHRTRRWLERCLSQSDLQHCPILWRLYLQLEMYLCNITRLKGIFYRAIQQCPWAKSLYMEGIRCLGSDMLQELVDLMVEKELRVQIPVEELDILLSP